MTGGWSALRCVLMSGEQRIERPNEAERAWIQANLQVSRSFATSYSGARVAERVPPLELLDHAWTQWLGEWEARPPAERDDPNPVINGVGIAFGQHLVDALGLEWGVVTDEYGTELAVHGEPANIIVFPANLIAKRFEGRTVGFIVQVFHQVRSEIQSMRS